jgi:hypothetical protein
MPKRLPANDPNVVEHRDINVPESVWQGTVDHDAYLDEAGFPPDPEERIIPETATGPMAIVELEEEDGSLMWTSYTIAGWAVDPMTVVRVT